MSKKYLCRGIVNAEEELGIPTLGVKGIPCGSHFFTQVMEINMVSAFESKNGQPSIDFGSAFKCDVCGTVVSLDEIAKELMGK